MAADPTRVLVTNLCAFSPTQTIELVGRAGVVKGNTRPDKVFLSGVSAGCLLSFACAAVLSCNASPWYAENAPGLLRLIAALIFPFGFVMITYVLFVFLASPFSIHPEASSTRMLISTYTQIDGR